MNSVICGNKMKSRKQLIVNLNYFDTVLDKWKHKEPLGKMETQYLKNVLWESDICKKCGEIDNQVRENKLQYSNSQFIEFISKWFIIGSSLLCFINAYFGLTIFISSIISYFVIRKVGLLTKCVNCGAINSFSPIKKYMKNNKNTNW